MFPIMFRFLLLLLALFASRVPATPAGERLPGAQASSGSAAAAADKIRLARTIYRHDFENYRDPDTGILLPESAAPGQTGWPDFWEPVRAIGFPEYLLGSIRVVNDESGFIPGNYRDIPNRVLRMEFDGTRVGIRTRTPVPVNPDLAYEFSLLFRCQDMQGARISAGVEWMRIESTSTGILRSDAVPNLDTGQIDWSAIPYRMLIGDVPPEANAARLFVIVDRDPDSVGGAYHGSLWLDDVALRTLPKIRIDPPRAGADAASRIIPVRYDGLFDNIPDLNNPGYFKGKRYSRQVDITDVDGQPVGDRNFQRIPIHPGEDGVSVEEISFPRDRYGVYYFNIRLFDADERLATDVMRAAAVMVPTEGPGANLALHSAQPLFGIGSGIIGRNILSVPGLLRRILERSGAKFTKIVPWENSYGEADQNNDYYARVIEEIRQLRTVGIVAAGVIKPPQAMFGEGGVEGAVATQWEKLNRILAEAGRQLGLYFDGWQWGGDADGSFALVKSGPELRQLTNTLREFAGGMPIIGNVPLGDHATSAFPESVMTTQGYLASPEPPRRLWPLAAKIFPWLYEPYYRERGNIYPPAVLSALAPPPPKDYTEETARKQKRTGVWLSLEPPPAYPHEPNAAAERTQLEDLMQKAVYAAALKPDVIFLGDLFDPERGMLRRDPMSSNTLETMARPIYLAAGTLSRLLEGTEYLGELYLLPPYEAHVFKKPGAEDATIALWHHDVKDELQLSRKEIANGPPMEMVDWAGNRRPLPQNIPVRRTPVFITGLQADLALTRMSLRIDPRLPVRSITRRQQQTVELVNHLKAETPVRLRLRYAARMPGGGMETNWVVQPDDMRLNLAPWSEQLEPGRLRYSVTPDPNSQVQRAGPTGSDRSGLKIARAMMDIKSSPAAEILTYLPFKLQSDLDVEVTTLKKIDDPNFWTLQLKLRWFPPEAERRRGEIRMTPYYLRRGLMKEPAAFPVTIKALSPEDRDNPAAPFQSYELRIPKRPQLQTWVGLDEVGGSNFYLVDVTDFILSE